jgi:hypothetical protein
MSYAKEGGHYYQADGTPCYEVPNKSKGGMRPTTLRDAKKMGLFPSVTTILKLLAAPNLEQWKQKQIMMAALTLPHIEGENLAQFEKRVWDDAGEQSRVAREEGTRIHGIIEGYYSGETMTLSETDTKFLDGVRNALDEAFGEQTWCAEKSFSSPLGFGGKVDLHSPFVIIDYKTKDFTEDDLKKPFSYENHILQLSAYRRGLGYPDAEIANVFISRTVPGLVKVETHKEDYWDRFECLLRYWQLSKNYVPENK